MIDKFINMDSLRESLLSGGDRGRSYLKDASKKRLPTIKVGFKYPNKIDDESIREFLRFLREGSPGSIAPEKEEAKTTMMHRKSYDETSLISAQESKDKNESGENNKRGLIKLKTEQVTEDYGGFEELSPVKKNAMYKEFLKWKAFEKIFEDLPKLNLFEAEKTYQKWIAYRVDGENIIKVLNVDRKQEYIFEEDERCPIEFLKFIEKGSKIIMGNRLLLYIWDLHEYEFVTFNILEHYSLQDPEKEDRILSKAVENFTLSINHHEYMLYFTIDNFIFLYKFPKSLQGKGSFIQIELAQSISCFFSFTKKNLIFTVTSSVKDKFMLEVRTAEELKLKNTFQINDSINYFLSPCISHSSDRFIIKFYVHSDSMLKYFEYDPDAQKSFLSSFSSKKPNNPSAAQEIFLSLVDVSFALSKRISNAWYATDQIAIIDCYNRLSSSSQHQQCIYSSDLKREIKSLPELYKGFVLISPMVFAYRKNILEIFTIEGSEFECQFSYDYDILSVSIISNFLVIEFENFTSCWKVKIAKSTYKSLKRSFEEADYKRFHTLHGSLKENIIDVLCQERDSENLALLLKNRHKLQEPNSIKVLNISSSFVGNKSTECTKILLDYCISLKDNLRSEVVRKDIEKNFSLIVQSDCSNTVQFIDSLLLSEIKLGNLCEIETPAFKFYQNKNKVVESLFFSQDTSETIEYNIQHSLIKLPHEHGSRESIRLTTSLMNCNISIFSSKFIKYFITKKWKDLWPMIVAHTLVLWVNCLLVMLATGEHKTTNMIFLGLTCINIFLVIGELIQALNQGLSHYIGISSIQYFGNLTFALGMSYMFVDYWFLLPAYGAAQLISLFTSHRSARVLALVRAVPYIAYFASVIFPQYEFYAIGAIFVYECVAGGICGLFGTEGRLLTSYLKIVIVVILMGSGIENIFLIGLFGLVFLTERINDMVRLRKSNLHMMDSLIIVGEISSIALLYFAYSLDSQDILQLLLIVSLCVQFIACYRVVSTSEIHYFYKFRGFALCYSFYLLVAYTHTDNTLYMQFFIIAVILEFLYLKYFKVVVFFDSIFSLLFNWNMIDLFRICVTFTWVIMVFYSINPHQLLTWFFIFLNFIRGLTGFRAFNSTRFYVGLILESVLDITAFFVIFIYITLTFGLLNSTITEVEGSLFQIIWVNPYNMIFGEEIPFNTFSLAYISFFIASFLLIVVMLNLLISILGKTFQDFQVESVELDYKEMIDVIYEIEILMVFRFCNRSNYFFAICDLPDKKSQSTVSVKHIRTLRNDIEALKTESQRRFHGIEVQLKEILELSRK